MESVYPFSHPIAKRAVIASEWALCTGIFALSGRMTKTLPAKEAALFGAVAFVIGRVTYPIFETMGREVALLCKIRGRRRVHLFFYIARSFFYLTATAVALRAGKIPLTGQSALGLVAVGYVLWNLLREIYVVMLKVIGFWHRENFVHLPPLPKT